LQFVILPSPDDPGRAWLLPILRDNIENTNLGHFIRHFVPMSERLYERALEREDGMQKTMESKVLETLVQQIWGLLPGYFDMPLDFPEVLVPVCRDSLLTRPFPDFQRGICRVACECTL
jgi:Ribosomal RNA-processing protein 12, HEAT repeats